MPQVKLVSPMEALSLVKDNITLGLGGGPLAMNPVALAAWVIAEQRRRLRLVLAPIGGFAADLLIAAGAADTVEFAQLALEEFGMAPAFRSRSQQGTLQTLDHT
ncbi:MAG: hypothetical protein M1571_06845 [Firmicutes bacterium]|nr:hypothetical protein [Bacillota bacterium]